MVMVAPLCEYIKDCRIVYVKRLDFCELYLNIKKSPNFFFFSLPQNHNF